MNKYVLIIIKFLKNISYFLIIYLLINNNLLYCQLSYEYFSFMKI